MKELNDLNKGTLVVTSSNTTEGKTATLLPPFT